MGAQRRALPIQCLSSPTPLPTPCPRATQTRDRIPNENNVTEEGRQAAPQPYTQWRAGGGAQSGAAAPARGALQEGCQRR